MKLGLQGRVQVKEIASSATGKKYIMKRMKHGEKCYMNRVQHENSATWESAT